MLDAYTYSDWNAPNITCLFLLLGKVTHYEDDRRIRLRAFAHCNTYFCAAESKETMLALRLYVAALTSLFLVLVIGHRGLGILEAVVITCAIVYLILDVRTDLHALRNELQLLQELESKLPRCCADARGLPT